MDKDRIIADHPNFPWLSVEQTDAVQALMRRLGWLGEDETIERCTRAGEGNMNLTLRVRTPRRSVILKQARPWVEKYDHIAAPWDRILFEQRYYQRIDALPPIASRMPKLLGCDADARVLLLEDLDDAADYTDLYSGAALSQTELDELARYARRLHDATEGEPDARFANREMRELNHEHIYRFPLAQDNGLQLESFEPGLDDAAARLKQDAAYCRRVAETGERYRSDGPCLLHGDYFPGSWLRTPAGPRVIDPEFCFYGDRAFDLGCAAAHLVIAGRTDMVSRLFDAYGTDRVDDKWTARYAAAELMRRLIGVAQLPLAPTDGRRADLLDRSRQAMMTESLEVLCD